MTSSVAERSAKTATRSVVRIGDVDFNMIDYDNVRFAADVFRPDFEREIGELECRDDDVFLVVYPKSGTHLLREIVHMLQTGKTEYIGKNTRDFPICYQTPEYLNNMESPRVLHTHMPFRFLPKQHLNRKGKVITLFRNPKDAYVSNWHFMQGIAQSKFEFQDFLNASCAGKWTSNSWYEWRSEWVKMRETYPDYPVLVLRYEYLIQNMFQEVNRIAHYLGINHSEEFLREVVKASDFHTMKKAKSKLAPADAEMISQNGYDLYYRKGITGDWKSTFTVAQNEQFDDWMKKQVNDDNTEFPNYLDFYA